MALTLLQGPGGSGKSQLARDLMDAGQSDLLADVTPLWAAIAAVERDPATGKYPVRDESSPALAAALYVQATIVHHGLRENLNVVVTTSRPDQVARWQTIADQHGQGFFVQTVDPGREVVQARLADPVTGELSDPCLDVLKRWYGS